MLVGLGKLKERDIKFLEERGTILQIIYIYIYIYIKSIKKNSFFFLWARGAQLFFPFFLWPRGARAPLAPRGFVPALILADLPN